MTIDIENIKKAIDSLREELEAIDLYNHRAENCSDPELKEILIHNSNEEKEHASMLIEWIRRNDSNFDKELKEKLFKEWKIVDHNVE
jgi:uncharacterized protein